MLMLSEQTSEGCEQGLSHGACGRLVATPAEVGDHAIAWACIADGLPPLGTRIWPSLDGLSAVKPPADEVWLFLASTSADTGEALSRTISVAEAARAARFRFAADRASYTAAHSLLRRVLAAMADCDPCALSFVAERSGKPVPDPAAPFSRRLAGIHFNISHARGLVAVAIARQPVGVDVEQSRPVAEMRDLVIELMSVPALAAFDAEQDKPTLFMRLWTLSEAYLKASGEGLIGSTRDLHFTARGLPRLLGAAAHRSAGWQFGHAHGGTVNWRTAGERR